MLEAIFYWIWLQCRILGSRRNNTRRLQYYGRPVGGNGKETARGRPITGPAIRDVFCAKKKKARGGGAWLSGAIIKRG